MKKLLNKEQIIRLMYSDIFKEDHLRTMVKDYNKLRDDDFIIDLEKFIPFKINNVSHNKFYLS